VIIVVLLCLLLHVVLEMSTTVYSFLWAVDWSLSMAGWYMCLLPAGSVAH